VWEVERGTRMSIPYRSTTDCPFCLRISQKEYDGSSGYSVHFEPLGPVVPGHRLFVPRIHLADATENPYITGRTFEDAAKFALDQGQEFNLITSAGKAATQSILHLHIHYVPRIEGDGLHLPWTGQKEREAAEKRRLELIRENAAPGATHDYP